MGKELSPEQSQELMIEQEHSKNIHSEAVNVVLTAFEPYVDADAESAQNMRTSCWDSIKLVPSRGVSFRKPVNVHCYRMRNVYDFIAKQISRCWEKHNPDLLVVTSQHMEKELTELVFEEIATNLHRLNPDGLGRSFLNIEAVSRGPPILQTELDIVAVSKKLCDANTGLRARAARTSTGFQLCDFAYYISLSHDPQRSACIRVPDANNVALEHVADGLAFGISEMLLQLDNEGHLKN